MSLVHYGKNHFSLVDTKYTQHLLLHLKPRGLWYSFTECNLSWREWCMENNHMLKTIGAAHQFELDYTDIICLNTIEKMYQFNESYKVPIIEHNTNPLMNKIDWNSVAKLYKGIEINPYWGNLATEIEFFWYYGWDCASGVVWDTDIIFNWKPIGDYSN